MLTKFERILKFLPPKLKHRWKFSITLLIWAWVAGLGFVCQSVAAGLDESVTIQRSLVSPGDSTRIQQALAKARRGEAVTVAVIGGSITQGAKATKPENRYGNLLAAWWQKAFPNTKVKFVNAGIGATGSNYGALRAHRDLLVHEPDFVVVEYAVNDGNVQAAAETLEGLVRQILNLKNRPAIVLLFMMHQGGGNAQEWHAKVGAHYGLPMLSFRDALWPEIKAGTLKWEDVEADEVHPNDRGHEYNARLVTTLLDEVLKKLPSDNELAGSKPVPAPLFSDLFERTSLFEAEGLQPAVTHGWSYDAKLKAWTSDKPGSTIEFELEGQLLFTMHYVVRGPMGKAWVTVDGVAAKELNGWFDQTWGGYRQSNEILRQAQSGKHRVKFELLPDKSPGSTGTSFRILGLGAASLMAK